MSSVTRFAIQVDTPTADERDAHERREHAEAGVERVLPVRRHLEIGQREECGVAEGCSADDVRRHRREHDDAEGLGLEVAKDESMAKTTPAIGALNVAEILPAAPQATRS